MKKVRKFLSIIIILVIIAGTIITVNNKTTMLDSISAKISTLNAGTSDLYYHLDIRITDDYDDADITVNSISVSKSDGTAISMETSKTTDEHDDTIYEYKSTDGHANDGTTVALNDGDKITITISYSYNNKTATISLEYTLDEDDNECKGSSGTDTYGYDIELYMSDYIEEEVKESQYTYTINYYYDGEQDTSATITGTATENTTINYVDKIKDGYELDTENTTQTSMVISATEENVLNIYYISTTDETPKYNYTINYYYDGVQDTSATITGTAEEGTTINYTNKAKDGYELDTENTTQTSMVISATEENVLNIYYVSKEEEPEPVTYSYTINYYYDGVQDTSATITGTAEAGTTINYTDKIKDGYELDTDNTTQTSMVISATEENVLNIYYISKEEEPEPEPEPVTYSYTINYYYDGVQDTSATITGTAEEGTTINYTDKIKEGYELDTANTTQTSMVISATDDNVLNIYYVSVEEEVASYSYTINYYYDGVQDTDETITGTAEEGSTVQYTDKSKDGYELDIENTSATSLTISATGDNVLNIYYVTETENTTVIGNVKVEEENITVTSTTSTTSLPYTGSKATVAILIVIAIIVAINIAFKISIYKDEN